MQPVKEPSSIRQRLGSFLGGLGPSRSSPLPPRALEEMGRSDHATFFTDDVLRVRHAPTFLCPLTLCLHAGAGSRRAYCTAGAGDEGAARDRVQQATRES